MQELNLLDDKYIKLAITLKVNEMKRTQLSSLTYQHVESTLKEQWKKAMPISMHEAVNEIMKLHANDVVASLSMQAMVMQKVNFHEFDDLFKD